MVYSFILVALLTVPTVAWLLMAPTSNKLYGYVDKIPPRPALTRATVVGKQWQGWAERYYDVHFGFRIELIRSFNEAAFRLFREMPRLRLYSSPTAGLYSAMSLEHLSKEVNEAGQLQKRYQATATKLREVQARLEAQGKDFIVVIAASKPYVYPEQLSARYVAGKGEQRFEHAASFGRALKQAGVNVVDGAPVLRAFRARTGLSTHPASGLHWNVYAGCVIAQQVLDHVRRRHPDMAPFGCGIPRYEAPTGADADGLGLLNMWSDAGLAGAVPYPSVHAAPGQAWRPSMVFVSDSFADQIIGPLREANAFSRAVTSGYFRVRDQYDSAGLQSTHGVDSDPALTRRQVWNDIRASDVVVLQIVDYNLLSDGYGFAEYALEQPVGAAAAVQPAAQLPAPAAVASLRALALVGPGNRLDPFLLPTRLSLVSGSAELLAAADSKEWDVIAVLIDSARRPNELAAELVKRGYVIAVNSARGLVAVPGGNANANPATAWQWSVYGGQQGAVVSVDNNVPTIESREAADMGFHTQELQIDGPTLVRASFDGAIAGTAPRAAHLSVHGFKPIFDLMAGSYSAKDEYFVILPGQAAGAPVRLSFGLGGWAKGSGKLRLNALELYPLLTSHADGGQHAVAPKGALARPGTRGERGGDGQGGVMWSAKTYRNAPA
ncbi:MAG TPA: hypothetical protein VGC21_24465 [Telluria sp.]